MTNVPAADRHASHDLALIAAYASGDTDGAERGRAGALIDACDECARLHADLVAIGAAMAELPAPARPRDFRLTAEQAAALRPTGWRGVLAALSGPRFSFAAPLGSAMATLGLIVLLLAGPGLPIAGSSRSADLAIAPTTEQAAPESVAGAAAPSPGAAARSPVAEAASPAVGEALAPTPPKPSAAPDVVGGGFAAESPADGATAPDEGTGSDTANVAPGTSVGRDEAKTASTEAPASTNTALVVGAGLVLLGGVLLVSLRLIARRVG